MDEQWRPLLDACASLTLSFVSEWKRASREGRGIFTSYRAGSRKQVFSFWSRWRPRTRFPVLRKKTRVQVSTLCLKRSVTSTSLSAPSPRSLSQDLSGESSQKWVLFPLNYEILCNPYPSPMLNFLPPPRGYNSTHEAGWDSPDSRSPPGTVR